MVVKNFLSNMFYFYILIILITTYIKHICLQDFYISFSISFLLYLLRLEYEGNNSNYNSLQKLNGNNVSDSVLSALYTLMHIILTTTQ